MIIRKLIALIITMEISVFGNYFWCTSSYSFIDFQLISIIPFFILYFPVSIIITKFTTRLGDDRKPVVYIAHVLFGLLIGMLTVAIYGMYFITAALNMLLLAFIDEYLSEEFTIFHKGKVTIDD